MSSSGLFSTKRYCYTCHSTLNSVEVISTPPPELPVASRHNLGRFDSTDTAFEEAVEHCAGDAGISTEEVKENKQFVNSIFKLLLTGGLNPMPSQQQVLSI